MLYQISRGGYSIRFASPGGPVILFWTTGTPAEFRKWHAQMWLRLHPQGHENSVALDVHCIMLEVFCVVLAAFWYCFVALAKAPGRMKKVFLNHHRNPRTPKGDFRTRRARKIIPFWEFFFSFSYFGVSWEVSGTGLEKDDEKVRNQTAQTLEIVFPCTREHSFHFCRATQK